MSTTAVEEVTTAAAVGFWVDQAAAASQRITDTTAAAALATWQTFADWYDRPAVLAQARDIASMSLLAQEAVAALMAEYVAQVTALLRGDGRIPVPGVSPPTVRNGVNLTRVHMRPAEVFRQAYATTADEDLARERALDRAARLLFDDAMLAARDAQDEAMEALDVHRYRRELRPELSETGPCGLCVVAADRIYTVGDLLPIHGLCKCLTVGIVDGADVGDRLNRVDLERIYGAAGSTSDRAAMKNVRVEVNEHGELGPVLTYRGQTFTGPDDLGEAPGNPELIAERLDKLQGVLGQLMAAQRTGTDVAGALEYQRTQIARSRRRVADAA